ncbi:unnamed protein product [Didymodactylos carnosus]|nr:unnamed protein product [Didymodactylos carnosus]CAF3736224.1 unnamed protein product [Didymodactylos carnosus]
MGCLFFHPEPNADAIEIPKPTYSWDQRKVLNKSDYILDKLKDQTVFRLPGTVNGQQFIIQNCENCTIYVFDHTGQIQIDDCKHCRIFIGPVRGSIFIRDSENCSLATVCQQFRARDCHDVNIFLSCASQPIIESSHHIRFGCLTYFYEKLVEHYVSAGISPYNNNWSNIHDFTKIPDDKNYSLMDDTDTVFKYIPAPIDPSCSHLNISNNPDQSITPYTYGELFRERNDERCLIVLFHEVNYDAYARELIRMIRQSNIILVQSKCYTINELSADRIFGNRLANVLVTKGPVIGLELAGSGSVVICQQSINNLLFKFPSIKYMYADVALNDKPESGEYEQKIVNEFGHLLEKSKQLFNGLRDLPQYEHKQWQPYFGKTFDIYTKLWKFQQQHRVILDSKYRLKRWQIGEIASKIGQLYYHYYIRTSETNYLNEAFAFYSAIRTRAYYSKVNKEEKPDLMVKKLRYYARFIVVCLLLKKTKIMRELVRELNRQVDEYVKSYDPDDRLEWQLVLNEITTFIDIDNYLNVNQIPITLSNRLTTTVIPPLSDQNKLIAMLPNTNQNLFILEEILIIGNCQDQIKFSELTLDMFRLLQAVEREPTEFNYDERTLQSPAPSTHHRDLCLYDIDGRGDRGPFNRNNPHKYLLYKPTFSQLYVYLASAFRELPLNGVLLLYISADGYDTHSKVKVDHSYDFGGCKANSRREDSLENNNNNPSPSSSSTNQMTSAQSTSGKKSVHEVHSVCPGDIYPFLRKPMFLIVDSTNSVAFQNMPNLFGQPLVSLLSPVKLPTVFHDYQNKGSLFTLFLTSPALAFCFVCNISELSMEIWEKCQEQVNKIIFEVSKLFLKSKLSGFYPSSQPALSNDLLENVQVHKMIFELSSLLNVRQLFLDALESG